MPQDMLVWVIRLEYRIYASRSPPSKRGNQASPHVIYLRHRPNYHHKIPTWNIHNPPVMLFMATQERDPVLSVSGHGYPVQFGDDAMQGMGPNAQVVSLA